MEYKTHKYLMNEKHCLVQIEKDDQFKWLSISIEFNTVNELKLFKTHNEVVNDNNIEVLSFDDAELRYDARYGKFVTKTLGFILENRSAEILPDSTKKLIDTYIM